MQSLHAESKVLQPLSDDIASEAHENEWPEFTLNNATVLNDSGQLISLLTANASNLLILRGELGTLGKDLKHHYQKGVPRKPVFIEVRPVGRYAFGHDPENNVTLWASGRAGWFIVRPNPEYEPFFADMSEAVTCWYFAIDKHVKGRGKISFKDVFADYAKQNGMTYQAAQSIFHRHAQFIASNMKKNDENIAWGVTSFYQHLRGRLPDAFSAIDPKPVPVRGRPAKLPDMVTQEPRQLDNKNHGRLRRAEGERSAESGRKRSKEPKESKAVLQLEVHKANGALLWKGIQSSSANGLKEASLCLELVASYIFRDFEFDSKVQAANYIRFQAAYLVRHMQERRHRKLNWMATHLYAELLNTTVDAHMKGSMARLNLQRRSVHIDEEQDVDKIYVDATSDEELAASGHRTKSLLRPKLGAAAGKGRKGKSIHGKGPRRDSESDQQQSGLQTPAKRKFATDSSGQESGNVRKRLARTRDEEEFSQADDAAPDLPSLTLRWRKQPFKSSSGSVVETQPPVSLGSNARGDIWTCNFVGCVHNVYGASSRLGKRLIDQHIEEHENDPERSQIDLVIREMGKTNLPVSNLIKRIRDLTAAQELATAMSAEPVLPASIRRLVA